MRDFCFRLVCEDACNEKKITAFLQGLCNLIVESKRDGILHKPTIPLLRIRYAIYKLMNNLCVYYVMYPYLNNTLIDKFFNFFNFKKPTTNDEKSLLKLDLYDVIRQVFIGHDKLENHAYVHCNYLLEVLNTTSTRMVNFPTINEVDFYVSCVYFMLMGKMELSIHAASSFTNNVPNPLKLVFDWFYQQNERGSNVSKSTNDTQYLGYDIKNRLRWPQEEQRLRCHDDKVQLMLLSFLSRDNGQKVDDNVIGNTLFFFKLMIYDYLDFLKLNDLNENKLRNVMVTNNVTIETCNARDEDKVLNVTFHFLNVYNVESVNLTIRLISRKDFLRSKRSTPTNYYYIKWRCSSVNCFAKVCDCSHSVEADKIFIESPQRLFSHTVGSNIITKERTDLKDSLFRSLSVYEICLTTKSISKKIM